MKYIIFLLLLFTYLSIKSAVISGNISDKTSGEVIIGASVSIHVITSSTDSSLYSIVEGQKVMNTPVKGAFSNQYGFYSIANVNGGKYALVVKSIGYEVYYRIIEVKENNIRVNIEINSSSVLTEEVTVVGDKDFTPTAKISSVEISPTFINKMPQLFSEVDVFRTLQLLPGVASANELSSGLYVRGGSPDQNLILLDGVIVYNPSHMAGFLSTFNSDALNDIKLIKGALPAEYGGRLSAVLDMYMKEGTKERVSGKGAISLISSKLTLEGPITEDATFMVSGRRFYFDLLTAAMPDDNMPQYYFYDLNGKVNIKLGENDRIFASGYFGRDVMDYNEKNFSDEEGIDFNWGNKTFNLRWKHIASPVLFTNFSLIYTNYNSKLSLTNSFNTGEGVDNSSFASVSGIEDFTFNGKSEYFGIDNHLIKVGFEFTKHQFVSGVTSNFAPGEFIDGLINDRKIDAIDLAIYAQDEWKITDKLSTNYGTRLYYFQQGDYIKFEPRFSLSYQLTDRTTLVGSAAAANQFLHLIVRNDINLPTDLWFPSTSKVAPEYSTQAVLGVHNKLGKDRSWTLNIEGYYKDMQNLLEYKQDAQFTLGTPVESQFTKGFGWAYGLEVFLEKKIGKFTGWIGYTLALTKRKFAELNNGNSFFPRYDRRHDFSIVTTFEISESWEVGASWIYATGQAYTMPTGLYQDVGLNGTINGGFDGMSSVWGSKYQYTDRNGFRLPSYHRLDLNLMYKYKWFGLPWVASINVFNTYNRKNPFAWYIDTDYDESRGKDVKKLTQMTLFPIIPTVGLSFEF